MTVAEMKQRKEELGYTYQMISEKSGVPLSTVQKIFSGATDAPRYETLMALEKVLSRPAKVREAAAFYQAKRQGEYTLEDYYQIPEERRVELIDGVIYDMAAPTSAHQLIAGLLYAKLLAHVMEKKGTCLPMISPLDVQLDCDNRTMIQPDVVVVCDRKKVIMRCVYGAPDFVAEVLSKSSTKRDTVIKLNKYLNAGVREYWLIDPAQKKVIVYDFESGRYPTIYGFDAKIPVSIWGGECVIDFEEVYEYIGFLYELGDVNSDI